MSKTFLVAQTVKRLSTMQESRVRFLGREDLLEKEMDFPLQYSCLENPMNGGDWQTAVHGVATSRTRLSDFTFSLTLQLINMSCELSQLIIQIIFPTFSFANKMTTLLKETECFLLSFGLLLKVRSNRAIVVYVFSVRLCILHHKLLILNYSDFLQFDISKYMQYFLNFPRQTQLFSVKTEVVKGQIIQFFISDLFDHFIYFIF